MKIQEPASATDGYSTGLHVLRDASACKGGTHGHVNTACIIETIAGEEIEAFEWAHLSLLHNYANKGENCASYVQANKHGTGSTWGQCVEACDITPGDKSGLVAQEVDCWVTGEDNGLKFGQDILVGDGPQIRGLGKSDMAEGTAAIRIGNTTMSPHARWKRGIQMYGNVDCLFDLTEAKTTKLFRLSTSQWLRMNIFSILAASLSIASLILHLL